MSLWSIGHSNVSFQVFMGLVENAGIECIADVRSTPYSRYTPHFNRDNLESQLRLNGVQYEFYGESLGGRPTEMDFYDASGHVLYRELAKSYRFKAGLEELCMLSDKVRTAMMCSEESPENCHRRLLIGRVLRAQGIDVLHVHGDGQVLADSELASRFGPQETVTLFGVEEDEWRSIRPVLQSGRRRSSFDD